MQLLTWFTVFFKINMISDDIQKYVNIRIFLISVRTVPLLVLAAAVSFFTLFYYTVDAILVSPSDILILLIPPEMI